MSEQRTDHTTDPQPTDRQRVTVARVIGAVVVLVLAWWFAGWVGLLVAALGLALLHFAGPRWVGGAACASLAVAAIATLVESSATNIAFAASRPVAAEAGRIAGVLALVALAGFIARERQTEPSAQPDELDTPRSTAG